MAARPGAATSCDAVELDLQTTADGDFVVFHDRNLPDGTPVLRTTTSTVRAIRLADGSPIPTLEAALTALAGVEVFVEAKTLPRGAMRSLLDVFASWRGAVHVHSFDHRVIARLRHLDHRISLGVLSCSYPIDPVRQVRDAGATTLWQEACFVDEALVRTCRQSDIAVVAWTVNEAAEALRLRELGVDGICGNYPERLRG